MIDGLVRVGDFNRLTLFALFALCSLLVVAAVVAIVSRVRFGRDLDPEEEQRKSVDDLQRTARKVGKKLGRSASAFRWMSRLLASIEIVGAAYFTWSGYSPTDTGANMALNSGHLAPVSYLGFAVIFAAAIQNRVHPYAKGVELQFRVWELANALRMSKIRQNNPQASHLNTAEALSKAIALATKPFSDRAELHYESDALRELQ